jgi:hypothetical protein
MKKGLGGYVAQVVQHLLTKCKDLSSNPCTFWGIGVGEGPRITEEFYQMKGLSYISITPKK